VSDLVERVAAAIRRAKMTPGLWTPSEIEADLGRPYTLAETKVAEAAIEAMNETSTNDRDSDGSPVREFFREDGRTSNPLNG
jgi:hypothetical protein